MVPQTETETEGVLARVRVIFGADVRDGFRILDPDAPRSMKRIGAEESSVNKHDYHAIGLS